ncbi:MAG: LytTR family DNA-binding domain-containing protein [Bernardetiaceae bacterium]|jgi:DNA-binding LytR/AlgR family response regulator|nr:LytTR family DNA-binding domain-containing protein [Bernardetiaceae bacterium]
MRTLIVEDEPLAAERLNLMLNRYDPGQEVLATTDSVEDTVRWLLQNEAPDLLLMDIHLADGLCFNIFKHVEVACPVIFTTSYDRYAIQAFQVHSIDYLLKPINYQGLAHALEKWQNLRKHYPTLQAQQIGELSSAVLQKPKTYKTRLLIKFGDHLHYKNLSDTAYFYADGKTVYLVGHDARRFVVEYTLEELEEMLDPTQFFRLNRKIIAQIEGIKDVRILPNSRYRVLLKPPTDDELFVSRDRWASFKEWLEQ